MSCYNILYESDSDSAVGGTKVHPVDSLGSTDIEPEPESSPVDDQDSSKVEDSQKPDTEIVDKLWDPSGALNKLMQSVYMFLTKLPASPDNGEDNRFLKNSQKECVNSIQDFSTELINIIKTHGKVEFADMLEYYDIISFAEDGNEIPPYKTTLKECFFAAIARSNIVVKTRADYAILDSVLDSDRSPIRLSALLEARDIENSGDQYKFKDSGVYLKDCPQAILYCESIVYVMKYLRRKKMLNIDYKQFNGSVQIPGLKGLPMEKFNKDRNGVCYNNLWDREKKFDYSESFYYNKLMALLSYIKFLLYKKD